MSSSLPKIRTDLIFTERVTSDGVSFVIKDPLNDHYFHFGEAERFILQQLDGETNLDVVRARAEKKFDSALPYETLKAFLGNCKTSGLLDTGEQKTKKSKRRLDGNLLYLRFKLYDPDDLLTRLVPRIGFFFTSYFMFLSFASIAIATCVLITNWSVFVHALLELRYGAIPVLLAVSFFVVSLHELAHGLTCKRFGGSVHEIGFMLIYAQPCLYCNVSDAWLFPEKKKRLWVGFAGPYFELFIWSVATLAWQVTVFTSWINYVSLIIMASSGLKTLVNFNPFIKYDGYYLLSDFLEIPNLRRRAFRYVGMQLERLVGRKPPLTKELTKRERLIYLVYGTISFAASFALILVLIGSIGGYIAKGTSGLVGALFAVAISASWVQRRMNRLFGIEHMFKKKPKETAVEAVVGQSPQSRPTSVESTGNQPRSENNRTESIPVPTGDTVSANKTQSGRNNGNNKVPGHDGGSDQLKKKVLWKKRCVYVAVLGALGVYLFFGKAQKSVTGPFDIIPTQNASVRTTIAGIVKEVDVHEGQFVQVGDTIAKLSDETNSTDLKRIEYQISQNKAKLLLLKSGPTLQQIKLAQTDVDKAQVQVHYSGLKAEMSRKLYEKNIISKGEIDDAEGAYALAQRDLESSKAKLAVLLQGPRPQEIEASQAEIASLEAQQEFLSTQIKEASVVTPASGIIATPEIQLREMAGQAVTKGALIVKVFDFRKVIVEIVVSEDDIGEVRVGQKVVLKARAYPNKTFSGVVEAIAIAAEGIESSTSAGQPARSSKAANTFIVATEIENSSLLLKAGMGGEARILCRRARVLNVLIDPLVHTLKTQFWTLF